MEHNKYKELNTLSVYEELKPEEQSELLHHLVTCHECLADFEEKRTLKENLLKTKLPEPDAALLNQARRELRIALGNEIKGSPLKKIFETIISLFTGRYQAIAVGTAMALIGLFAGKFIFNANPVNQKEEVFQTRPASLLQDNMQITNVKFADNVTADGKVDFSFDAVKPVHIKGNINDPKIQSILSYAMVNGDNAGVRLNSISLINSGTAKKLDNDVKNAIVNVVKNDANPGVRREGLKLLRKVAYDDEIKKALLYVLSNDKNTGMRIEALNILMDAQKDGHNLTREDLNILKENLKQDNNQYIQYRVKSVLKENV
jgi:hypothetical protein